MSLSQGEYSDFSPYFYKIYFNTSWVTTPTDIRIVVKLLSLDFWSFLPRKFEKPSWTDSWYGVLFLVSGPGMFCCYLNVRSVIINNHFSCSIWARTLTDNLAWFMPGAILELDEDESEYESCLDKSHQCSSLSRSILLFYFIWFAGSRYFAHFPFDTLKLLNIYRVTKCPIL